MLHHSYSSVAFHSTLASARVSTPSFKPIAITTAYFCYPAFLLVSTTSPSSLQPSLPSRRTPQRYTSPTSSQRLSSHSPPLLPPIPLTPTHPPSPHDTPTPTPTPTHTRKPTPMRAPTRLRTCPSSPAHPAPVVAAASRPSARTRKPKPPSPAPWPSKPTKA